MKKLISTVLIVCMTFTAWSQGAIQGRVIDKISREPLELAYVRWSNTTQGVVTNKQGYFILNKRTAERTDSLTISFIGFATQVIKTNAGFSPVIEMEKGPVNLQEVLITPQSSAASFHTISKIDLNLQPVRSAQDILRTVPGLFIGQHQGGGKAEQIFLRGFDIDHGTDINVTVDGLPVNMVSHAHGQGYADLHFLIPETVRELEVNKGPYATRYGDLATSGSGEFKTLNAMDKNVVKAEYGSFNTVRGLAMLNLLNKNQHLFSNKNENFYVAGEYRYTDSYFNRSQHFNRLNFFSKYSGILNNGSFLQFSASTFHSIWDASGQIPQRAIDEGSINRYGSIDPTEGGKTGRTNVTLVHQLPFKNGYFKNQLYYSRYDFNLYSNFTFYLNDSLNGDQIQQGDHRNIFGYNSVLQLNGKLGQKNLTSQFGAGARYDNSIINLSHTIQRELLNDYVKGKLNQLNAWIYTDENLDLTKHLKLNTGVRLDVYNFDFNNQTYDTASGQVVKALASPKLNLFYTFNNQAQFFIRSGFGFHSNDARAVVVGRLNNTLARALGYETGTTFKPFKKMMVNIALWALHLQSELVYVGDEGIVEAAGRTQRYGIDFGFRYQIWNNWFVDADVNYNHGRLIDEPNDANRIPLAPVFTSIGGISYKKTNGLNGSIRYRYMGNRPAVEDNSIVAKGYTLVDAVINYTLKKYQLGITIENVLNTQWEEAQFATQSRLQHEPAPVTEIHYTPGTPLAIKGSVTVFF